MHRTWPPICKADLKNVLLYNNRISEYDKRLTHQYQPAQTCLANLAEPTLHQSVVNGWNHSRQSEAHECTFDENSSVFIFRFKGNVSVYLHEVDADLAPRTYPTATPQSKQCPRPSQPIDR